MKGTFKLTFKLLVKGSVIKFEVLALDCDGIIARNGKLDPDVRTAVMEVRARGIVAV